MKSIIAAFAMATGLAGAALAQDKPATPVAAPAAPTAPASPTAATPAATKVVATETGAKPKSHDSEIVCFNDLDTGSHLRRTRVCMTRAQRDQREKDGEDAMDALKNSGRNPIPQAPGP